MIRISARAAASSALALTMLTAACAAKPPDSTDPAVKGVADQFAAGMTKGPLGEPLNVTAPDRSLQDLVREFGSELIQHGARIESEKFASGVSIYRIRQRRGVGHAEGIMRVWVSQVRERPLVTNMDYVETGAK